MTTDPTSPVTRWLAETDPHKADRLYREEVFPLSCERIREQRPLSPRRELLFVPVGTQEFAPILAVLGTPASCVALLESAESAPYGQKVETHFAGSGEVFLHVRIDETDVLDIGQKMRAVYASRGLPSASSVAVDITGGRKTMSAAIAGVASLFEWDIFYIEAKFVRERGGYSYDEQLVRVGNVLFGFGATRREEAVAALARGECAYAARIIEELIEQSATEPRDKGLMVLAQAAHALREGDVRTFLRQAADARRTGAITLARTSLSALKAAEATECRFVLLCVGAFVCSAEGKYRAFDALAQEALSLVNHGPEDDRKKALTALKRFYRMSYLREAAQDVDAVFGTGLARTVEVLP